MRTLNFQEEFSWTAYKIGGCKKPFLGTHHYLDVSHISFWFKNGFRTDFVICLKKGGRQKTFLGTHRYPDFPILFIAGFKAGFAPIPQFA